MHDRHDRLDSESDCSVEVANSMFPNFFELFSKPQPAVPGERDSPRTRCDIQRARFGIFDLTPLYGAAILR